MLKTRALEACEVECLIFLRAQRLARRRSRLSSQAI